MKAHLHYLESSTGEELRRVKACLEQQRPSQLAGSEQREERPVLHALPSLKQSSDQTRTLHVKGVGAATPAAPTHEKFDARAFVFACLHENLALKLTEIEQRARAAGQELSQPTASRYRKQFFTSRESSANDERRAVGEE